MFRISGGRSKKETALLGGRIGAAAAGGGGAIARWRWERRGGMLAQLERGVVGDGKQWRKLKVLDTREGGRSAGGGL